MRKYTVRIVPLSALLLTMFGLTLYPVAHAAPPDKQVQQQLIHAVIQNQMDVIPGLLKQGGDPNARVAPAQEDAFALTNINDNDPAPPLIVLACRYGYIHSPNPIDLLVQKGADVNIADRNGVTPLMVASQMGFSASLLVAHGAKVNVHDRNGQTPLMYAMNNFGLNTASLLLDKGADINAQNKFGFTPLMIAIAGAVHDPVMLYGEDLVKKAKEEKVRYLELLQFLIDRKADLNRRDKSGTTALKMAIAQQQPEVAQLLRKAGAKE
jgi:ankyrin repeat protein